jgi:hypothetical protein
VRSTVATTAKQTNKDSATRKVFIMAAHCSKKAHGEGKRLAPA